MPCVVYIRLKDANHTSKSEQSKYPVLLAVNRELQEVALKDLKRYTKFSDKKLIYVNFGLDIFYISCFDTSGLDKANYDSYIQVLALNSKYFANSLCEFL
jgi:lipopolysaccharide biosynthesis protein